MVQKAMGNLPPGVAELKACTERPAPSKPNTDTDDQDVETRLARIGMCFLGGMDRPWSDLPTDLLREICKRLHSVDCIRFRAVCKNWHAVGGLPSVDKLPWLMRYNQDNIVDWCTFIDPSYSQSYDALLGPTYTIDNQYHEDEKENYSRVKAHASRKGWLLLQSSNSFLFFYNPFKKEIIKLPSLDVEQFVAKFVGMPDSSECLVFVIERSREGRSIEIRTCHCGDSSWNAYSFNGGRSAFCTHAAYIGATFYCFFFRNWIVGAFDTVTKEWSLLCGLEQALPRISMSHHTLMIEIDGQLFLVHYPSILLCHTHRPKYDRSNRNRERFYVEKLDFAEKKWCIVNRLEDRIVFLDFLPHTSSYFLSAEGETRDMANRIYYNAFSCSWFYSMKTRRHHLCSEFNNNFFSHKKLARLWIENPL